MRKISLCLLGLAMAALSVAAPYCDIRKFSILDGLAANTISDMVQGSDNLMWFGTQNGLSFYDGYSFHTFRDLPGHNETLSTNRILFLRACNNNDVWCVTYDHQLYVYDTRLCEFVAVGKELGQRFGISLRVKDIYALKNKTTWITTDGQDYIVRMNSKEITDQSPELIRVGQHGLRSANVRYITADKQGRQWILTDKGVTIYNHSFSSPIPFNWIRQVGNDMFLSTADGRLAIFDEHEHLSMIKMPQGVTRINEMKNTGFQLLIATNQGVVVYNPRTFKTDLINVQSPSQPQAEVKRIYVDAHSRVWAFTEGMGVTLIDIKTGQTKWLYADAPTPEDRTTSDSYFIMEDEHGVLWTIPNQGTFSYYDARKGVLVPYVLRTNTTGNNSVPKISRYAISDQGLLWLTGVHDLTQVNFKYHEYFLSQLDRGESEVRAIAQTLGGQFWDGYRHGCIKISNSQNEKVGYLSPTGQIVPTQQPFARRGIYALFEDSRHRMWIGTDGDGLYLYDQGRVQHFVYDAKDKASLPSDTIYDVVADRNGNIWIATYGGGLAVVREQDGHVAFVSHRNGIKWPAGLFRKVRRITCTPGGDMLVGTCGGLVTFKDQIKSLGAIRFCTTSYKEDSPSSLDANDVNYTFVTTGGIPYISELGGTLERIKGRNLVANNLEVEHISQLNPDEGIVQGIVEDNHGLLWLVRESSIDKYDPKTGKMDVFGPNDFDYNMTFTEARPIHDPATDNISVGTPMGRITFNPAKLTKTSYQPKIIFTTLRYTNNNEVVPILHKEKIVIPSDKRNLYINFASLDYTRDYQMRYEYRIDNFSPKGEWTPLGSRRSIGFNRISHGHYVLKVRATNTHGVWSNYVAELKLDVNPTFWESIWGRMLIILFAMAFIVMLFYVHGWRQRQYMSHELSVVKNKFFSDASHKLRTPLALINGPVNEILANDDNLSSDSRELLQIVKRNALQMLEMLNKMLAFDNSKDFYENGGEQTPGSGQGGEEQVDDQNVQDIISQLDQTDAEATDEGQQQEESVGDKANTILIVEDNKDLQRFLDTILHKDYHTLLADNGMVGLQMARKYVPDFILTDVTMPVMDGITMVHLIKQDTTIAHIPVIVLSAKASQADHMKAFKEGVDGYLTKPFSADYLKERIENVIIQRRVLQQEMLRRIQQADASLWKGYVEATAAARKEQIAVQLQQEGGEAQTAPSATSLLSIPLDDKVMEKVVAFITERIADPDLKIDDIARAIGMSRSVLYGKIKSAVGMTPVDFVRHIRIMRATELLQQTNDTLTTIAYSVGFSDPKYFSKVFKKEIGIIPSEYRERTQK